MSIALWVVGLPLALWVCVCVAIWIWVFLLSGGKQDASGDMGLAIILLPIVPFALLYFKMKETFSEKSDTTHKD